MYKQCEQVKKYKARFGALLSAGAEPALAHFFVFRNHARFGAFLVGGTCGAWGKHLL
jgi:hypothetical protein